MRRAGAPLRTLSEARVGHGELISVCAFVLSVSGPFPSRGIDHNVHLHLKDASLPNEEDSLRCVIFGPQQMLTQLKGLDGRAIIYFHKALKRTYQGSPQLMIKLKPHRTPQNGDTFTVYHCEPDPGTAAVPPRPWLTSHGSSTGEQVDVGRIREVQRWLAACRGAATSTAAGPPAGAAPAGAAPAGTAPAGAAPALRTIRQLVPPWRQLYDLHDQFSGGDGGLEPVDLVCRVLAIDFTFLPDFLIAFVWDGTDAQPMPMSLTFPLPRPTEQHEQQPHSHNTPHAQPQPQAERGLSGEPSSIREVSAASDTSHRKRRREEEAEQGQTADTSAGGAGQGGEAAPPSPEHDPHDPDVVYEYDEEGDLRSVLTSRGLPHWRRLQMPLASIAQYGQYGPPAEASTADSLRGEGGGRSGWEAISAAVRQDEMPVAGTAVPLVLPAAPFTLRPAAEAPGAATASIAATADAAAAGGSCGAGAHPPTPSSAPAGSSDRQQQRTQQRTLPRPGEWVKLGSVVPRVVRGQVQLSYTEQSSMASAAEDDYKLLLEAYGTRCTTQGGAVLNQFAPQDPAGLIARAVRPWQALPLRTMRQLLLQQNTCDCTPARVVARVLVVRNLGEPTLPPGGSTAGTTTTHVPHTPSAGGAAQTAAGPQRAAAPAVAAAAPPLGDVDGGGGVEQRIAEELERVVFPATSLHVLPELLPGSRLDRSRNGRTYALVVQLEDGTGMLQAMLLGGAGNLFFWHMPPPGPPAHGDPRLPDRQTSAPQPAPTSTTTNTTTTSSAVNLAVAATITTGAATTAAVAASNGVQTRAMAPREQVWQPPQEEPSGKGKGEWEEQQGQQRQQPEEVGASAGSWGTDPAVVLATLSALGDQTAAPGGVWLECIIRPYYRDRGNPWQSAVYSVEHTVMRASFMAAAARGHVARPAEPSPATLAAREAVAPPGSPAPSI